MFAKNICCTDEMVFRPAKNEIPKSVCLYTMRKLNQNDRIKGIRSQKHNDLIKL